MGNFLANTCIKSSLRFTALIKKIYYLEKVRSDSTLFCCLYFYLEQIGHIDLMFL